MKLSDKIRVHIENEIRSGALLPGDTVDEQTLVSHFGASRTPIREAFLQLEAQGLLISQPRHGMVVSRMDVKQLLAIWELLSEMEGVCARLACERMTEAELGELATIHENSRAVVEADDIDGWRIANQEFHDCIYRGSRNAYLRQDLLRLRARTGAYLIHSFGALGRLQSSFDQHEQVLRALQNRDVQTASSLMRSHVNLDQRDQPLTDFLLRLPSTLLND